MRDIIPATEALIQHESVDWANSEELHFYLCALGMQENVSCPQAVDEKGSEEKEEIDDKQLIFEKLLNFSRIQSVVDLNSPKASILWHRLQGALGKAIYMYDQTKRRGLKVKQFVGSILFKLFWRFSWGRSFSRWGYDSHAFTLVSLHRAMKKPNAKTDQAFKMRLRFHVCVACYVGYEEYGVAAYPAADKMYRNFSKFSKQAVMEQPVNPRVVMAKTMESIDYSTLNHQELALVREIRELNSKVVTDSKMLGEFADKKINHGVPIVEDRLAKLKARLDFIMRRKHHLTAFLTEKQLNAYVKFADNPSERVTFHRPNWDAYILPMRKLLQDFTAFKNFKSSYLHQYRSECIKNPCSTMKSKLEADALSEMKEVEQYADTHKKSRTAGVLHNSRINTRL